MLWYRLTLIHCGNMWFGLFVALCVAVMVWDIVTDPHFKDKMKELEED